MKKILRLTALLFLLLFPSLLFAQNFQWVKQMYSTGAKSPLSITTDLSGNVISAGYYEGTLDFDPGAGTFNLTSTRAAYVQKLDSSGNFLWAIQITGTSLPNNDATVVATDASGNVYVAGDFKGTADFDPGPGTFNLSASGGTNHSAFILKLDANGNFVWARAFTGTSYSYITGMCLDAGNNIFIAGYFAGTNDFDPGANTANLISNGGNDVFIAKLNSSGNYVWAKQVGGTSNDACQAIALDVSGNVLTTGGFVGTVDFNPGSGVFNMTQSGTPISDAFILKLNSSGAFSWAKQIAGPSADIGWTISTDVTGAVYSTGMYFGTTDFDPGAGVFNMTPTGQGTYIQKLDANGNFRWARQFLSSGNTYSEIKCAVISLNQNLLITGAFYGTVDFDGGIAVHNLTTVAAEDMFIEKMDSAGNFILVNQIGGTTASNYAIGNSIRETAGGSIYSTGIFEGFTDFDPGMDTAFIYPPGSGSSIFVLKLSPLNPCATCPVPTNIASTNITGTAATITWDGNGCAVKYRVRYRVQGTTTWITKTITAPIVTKTLTGLTGLTTYEYQVRTDCNSTGTTASAYSAIQTFTTLCTCSKPANVSITNLAQTTATVNWLGNTCAVKYRLQYRKQGTTAWTTKTITVPTLFYNITGLTSNSIYEYHLRSDCNSTGSINSGWTTTATFTTPLRMEDATVTATQTMTVTPNPCFFCEITGAANANDLLVTDLLGRKLNVTFSQSTNGYYINLPETSNGIFFIQNIKTGEVVKFISVKN